MSLDELLPHFHGCICPTVQPSTYLALINILKNLSIFYPDE